MKANSKVNLGISTPLTICGHAVAIKFAIRARPFARELNWERSEAVVVVDLKSGLTRTQYNRQPPITGHIEPDTTIVRLPRRSQHRRRRARNLRQV